MNVTKRKEMTRRTGGRFFAGIAGGLAILGALVFAGATPSAQAADDIDLIAIDMNTAGNSTVSCAGEGCAPGTLGTIQSCAAIPVGGTTDIDIVVDEIPNTNATASGAGPNIQGFTMDLMYNPVVAQVSALPAHANGGGPPGNVGMNYAGTPGGAHFSPTDAVPDTDGQFTMAEVDAGPTGESGSGILMRLTLKGLAAGTSTLHLQDNTNFSPVPSIYDNTVTPNVYTIGASQDALIVVGGTCPQAVGTTTGLFCIFGPSTGTTWFWTVTGNPGPYSGSATVAAGGTAPDIADAWVDSMNGPSPAFAGAPLVATQLTGGQSHCFAIAPWNSTLTLIVDGCPVTTSGCSFNPTVFAVSSVGGVAELIVGDTDSQAPMIPLAGVAAAALALLATGGWHTRRRFARR